MAIMLITFLIGAWMSGVKIARTEANNTKVLAETHRLSELKQKLVFETGENAKLVNELRLLENVAGHRADWLRR